MVGGSIGEGRHVGQKPNSDKIVVWRFLRNRRLILRLQFSGLSYFGRICAVIFAITWLI